MFKRTTIAFATALILGTASVALAAPDTDPNGGYRESGAGAFAQQGINPVFHANSAALCQKQHPRTYDPSTMTFAGPNGRRVPCP